MMGESKSCMTSSFFSNLKSNFWTHAVLRSIPSNILEGKKEFGPFLSARMFFMLGSVRENVHRKKKAWERKGEDIRERNVGGDWEKNTGMSRRIYREVLTGILL